jgi:hypothetical protein
MMKTFISNEDFNKVLELLGLPGETISIEIGSRVQWVMAGVNSTWAMRAVIGVMEEMYDADHNYIAPYSEKVVYVPVMLPNDERRNAEREAEFQSWQPKEAPEVDVSKAGDSGGWCAPSEVVWGNRTATNP